nr:NADH dehydrogenase subunit 6 [Craspedonirmus immer]
MVITTVVLTVLLSMFVWLITPSLEVVSLLGSVIMSSGVIYLCSGSAVYPFMLSLSIVGGTVVLISFVMVMTPNSGEEEPVFTFGLKWWIIAFLSYLTSMSVNLSKFESLVFEAFNLGGEWNSMQMKMVFVSNLFILTFVFALALLLTLLFVVDKIFTPNSSTFNHGFF